MLHSTFAWLPLTETWIYGQITGLSPAVRSVVVAERRSGDGRFPFDRAYVASDRRREYLGDRVLRRTGLRRSLRVLERARREHQPQLLHSHYAHVGWQDAHFARRHGLPHVVSAYGADLTALPASQPIWPKRYRELFAWVGMVLCEGPNMGATAVALGCPPARVRIHPLGVDLARIPFRPRKRRNGEPLRVLMAGSFREKKGMVYGIEALALLRRRGVDVELTVVGDVNRDRDKEEGAAIEAAVRRYGGAIRRVGFLPHGALLEEAFGHHVFLSPSVTAADGDAEGGAPVAIIEMAASGMPVASTTHCDIPAVLGPPNREILVPERDVPALAASLQTLCDEDWHELVQANRAVAEAHHDVVKQSARLELLYREVLGG